MTRGFPSPEACGRTTFCGFSPLLPLFLWVSRGLKHNLVQHREKAPGAFLCLPNSQPTQLCLMLSSCCQLSDEKECYLQEKKNCLKWWKVSSSSSNVRALSLTRGKEDTCDTSHGWQPWADAAMPEGLSITHPAPPQQGTQLTRVELPVTPDAVQEAIPARCRITVCMHFFPSGEAVRCSVHPINSPHLLSNTFFV